jgi:pimeloyl-ACP methyl ester carboxylesterase
MPRIKIGPLSLNVEDRGRGQVLLLVHGFPLDHTMWQGQIEELSSSFRIIAPDLRGFGKSDVTPGTATMQQFADDLAALLDAMAIREPVTFCGLSMGGYVGWQFFQRQRAKLARLIQCDTRAIADTDEGRAARLKTAEAVLKEGAATVAKAMQPKLFSEQTAKEKPEIVAATQQVMLNTNPQAIAAALRGMAERPDVTSMLPKIDVPTLLVCGEQDAISPAKEMRGMAAAIPGAKFVEIAGAGHMAPLEDPAAVNRAIREFVSAS